MKVQTLLRTFRGLVCGVLCLWIGSFAWAQNYRYHYYKESRPLQLDPTKVAILFSSEDAEEVPEGVTKQVHVWSFAKGVGIIKRSTYNVIDDKRVLFQESELVKFVPSKFPL